MKRYLQVPDARGQIKARAKGTGYAYMSVRTNQKRQAVSDVLRLDCSQTLSVSSGTISWRTACLCSCTRHTTWSMRRYWRSRPTARSASPSTNCSSAGETPQSCAPRSASSECASVLSRGRGTRLRSQSNREDHQADQFFSVGRNMMAYRLSV